MLLLTTACSSILVRPVLAVGVLERGQLSPTDSVPSVALRGLASLS